MSKITKNSLTIVKFDVHTYGIRGIGKKSNYQYLDIPDALGRINPRCINWHRSDQGEYIPGEEAFDFCTSDAKEVLEAWEWLKSEGDNQTYGKPITENRLKAIIENQKK